MREPAKHPPSKEKRPHSKTKKSVKFNDFAVIIGTREEPEDNDDPLKEERYDPSPEITHLPKAKQH